MAASRFASARIIALTLGTIAAVAVLATVVLAQVLVNLEDQRALSIRSQTQPTIYQAGFTPAAPMTPAEKPAPACVAPTHYTPAAGDTAKERVQKYFDEIRHRWQQKNRCPAPAHR